MEKKREPGERITGFYWVKFAEEWIIAEYYAPGEYWYIPGSTVRNPTRQFSEIDERPITREQ